MRYGRQGVNGNFIMSEGARTPQLAEQLGGWIFWMLSGHQILMNLSKDDLAPGLTRKADLMEVNDFCFLKTTRYIYSPVVSAG